MKACASVGARQVRLREAATVRQSRSAAGSQSHLGSPRSAPASLPGQPRTAPGTPALLRAGAEPEQHEAGQARLCSVRRTGSRRARCGRSWRGWAAHTSTPTWPTATEPAAAAQSSTSPVPAPRIETRRSPAVSRAEIVLCGRSADPSCTRPRTFRPGPAAAAAARPDARVRRAALGRGGGRDLPGGLLRPSGPD